MTWALFIVSKERWMEGWMDGKDGRDRQGIGGISKVEKEKKDRM